MVAYITGASKGIGKALALNLLSLGHEVIGLSRSCSITHELYTHIKLDLSDVNGVVDFQFKNHKEDVVLINNAGIIGEIKSIGSNTPSHFVDLNTINISSPQILSNKFVAAYISSENNFKILNISSGAGRHAIDAWAAYCGSKAAIDLFSETIQGELIKRGCKNWSVYSIAPGVVDTDMQKHIRNAKVEDFQALKKFIDLKNNNELTSPKKVAEKLTNIINETIVPSEVKIDLRTF